MNKKLTFLLCIITVLLDLGCCSYLLFSFFSSDYYAYKNIDSGKCIRVDFENKEWMKIKVYGTFKPRLIHFKGAVYVVDSSGKRAKISGGYVKAESMLYRELKRELSQCKTLDEAWHNGIWECAFPWNFKERNCNEPNFLILLSFFEFGVIWMAIPIFIGYPILSRLVRKKWSSVFSWLDLISCLMIHLIWYCGVLCDFNQISNIRALVLIILNLLFGVIVILRVPIVWHHPEWCKRIAIISLLILFVLSLTTILID